MPEPLNNKALEINLVHAVGRQGSIWITPEGYCDIQVHNRMRGYGAHLIGADLDLYLA